MNLSNQNIIRVITIILLFILHSCRSKTTDSPQLENKENTIVKNDSINIQPQKIENFSPTLLAKKYKKYNGSMFDIQYPDNFIVKTSNESSWEAFFKSPDSLVEFYVFSPWGITENQEI